MFHDFPIVFRGEYLDTGQDGVLPDPYLLAIVPLLQRCTQIAPPSLGTGSEENKANLNPLVRAIRHAVTSPRPLSVAVLCLHEQISGPLAPLQWRLVLYV